LWQISVWLSSGNFHGVMGSSSSWLGFTGFTNVLKAQRIKTIPLDCWLVPKLSSSIPIAMSWTAGFQLITVSGYSDNGTSSNCLVSFDIYIYMYVSSTIFSIQWCVKDGQVILFNRHSDLLLSWVQARISWKPTAWKVTGVKYTVYTNPKQLVTIKFKCSKMIPIPETCVVFPVFRNFPFVIWDDWPHPKGWRTPKRTLAVPKGTPILGTKYEFDIAWQRDHNGTWFRKVLFCSRGKPEAKSGHAGIPILRFHRWRWLFWGLDVSTGRSQKIIVSISSSFFSGCVCVVL